MPKGRLLANVKLDNEPVKAGILKLKFTSGKKAGQEFRLEFNNDQGSVIGYNLPAGDADVAIEPPQSGQPQVQGGHRITTPPKTPGGKVPEGMSDVSTKYGGGPTPTQKVPRVTIPKKYQSYESSGFSVVIPNGDVKKDFEMSKS